MVGITCFEDSIGRTLNFTRSCLFQRVGCLFGGASTGPEGFKKWFQVEKCKKSFEEDVSYSKSERMVKIRIRAQPQEVGTCNLSCTGSWKVSQQPTQRSFLPAGLRLKHKHLPRLLSPRGLPMDISEGSIRGRKPVYVQLASLLDKSMLAVRKKIRRCIRTAMNIIWMGYN